MKKIIFSIALIIPLILIGAIVYLLIRPCDYQAHFTVKTTPDIAFFSILNWDIWNRICKLIIKKEFLSNLI